MCASTYPIRVCVSTGSLVFGGKPAAKSGIDMIKGALADPSCTLYKDDAREDRELAKAAAHYAFSAARCEDDPDGGECPGSLESEDGSSCTFPNCGLNALRWEGDTLSRKEQLARCGMFCAREIDRLTRLEEKAAKEAAERKAKEAQKPRRFKYLSGTGVFDPQTRIYKYLRNDGNCGESPLNVFCSLEWIDAAPLN